MKLLTIFLLLIFFLVLSYCFFTLFDKELVVYELESDNKVFGVCSGYTCRGFIKTNTTINDIREVIK